MAGSATALFIGGGTAVAEPTPVKPTPIKPRAEHIEVSRGTGQVIKDSYIVVFKDGKAKAADVATHVKSLTNTYGGSARRTFTKSLRGYSAKMTAAQAKELAKDPDVAFVEQNRLLSKSATAGSWGIDRIDQQWVPLDGSYTAPNTASDVTVYVIDSGIDISHPEFGGRARYGIDVVDESAAPTPTSPGRADDTVPADCDGHGTHVAGTIGSKSYGVAKGVQLVAVQVLDCAGVGSVEEVIAGIDWVTANAEKPAVANMSLGGSASAAIDKAVEKSIASGVTYVVAAGNGTENKATGLPEPVPACNVSPARVPAAITVSATDVADFRVSWAGLGTCVDIFAPGNDIVSTYHDAVTGKPTIAQISGTSMASPHVAGAAALLLADNEGMTPQQVRDRLVGTATRGAVKNLGTGSPDRLLRIGSGLPSTTALRAAANGKLVTTPGAGASALIASGSLALQGEQFDLVKNSDGTTSFRARSNGRYVTAERAGAQPLIANRTAVGPWEKFDLSTNADGTVSVKALANGKYVTAERAGAQPLIANRTAVGPWEKFTWTSPVPVISLLAYVNEKIVSAETRGTKPLIANRAGIGVWEQFDIIDRGNGNVALRAHANGRFVAAERAGAQPLIANRTAVGPWETFQVLNLGGPVAFKAAANSRWVSAESRGTKPLIANRTSPAASEAFFLL
ncbi:hypothetical protein GCM10022251_60900 [Phytohabitans flavus]|uniref:Peptidase S8/S53 domain-containing protein n=1 Tax=Phytohabitans flavus TaxID=1076124 RepID=A0A6F8Y4M8_9ACTN|nr:hypothetical protein Pflav_073890 [Phytohabitans flavus]